VDHLDARVWTCANEDADKEAILLIIYLVQHGKAFPKEADPERSLTEGGKAETRKVATRAEKLKLHVSEIVHSGKKRAYETAEILASHLTPGRTPTTCRGLDPNDDVAPIAEWLGDKDGYMLVGHLPFLEKLVSFLIASDPTIRLIQFTNSGIVCLEAEEGESGKKVWSVKWAMTPEIA
jgi:phosphohistidine phosphatase